MPALSRREQLKQESGSYVPKLVACFYAVFDPTLGPRVVHQIPEGSVATALSTFPSRPETPGDSAASTLSPPPPNSGRDAGVAATGEPIVRSTPVLFDFSSVIDFVIPKPELCGHLITKATRTSKILGLPIRIVDEDKYHHSKAVYNRNAFIFNVCFVFERDAELSVYEPVVWKTARQLGQMEESSSLLSSPPPSFSMANLLEQLYLDLNAYSETSISLLDTDLNLFLLPFYANPPDVKVWDVPIAVVALESMKSYSWDVTLFKVCSFIDGVNHVKRIAELAEVDLYLARMCIQHLVYYNAVILIDLFQFSNSYTPLPGIADIAQYGEEEDEGATDLRTECENYVHSGSRDSHPVPFPLLLSYYSRLRPGLTVSSWMDELSLDTQPIDVRRMIQFGVIKGFLRRVYAYPVWLDHPALRPQAAAAAAAEDEADDPSPAGRGRHARSSSARPSATSSTSLSLVPPSPSLIDAPAPAAPRTALLLPTPPPASPPPPVYPPSLPRMLDGSRHTDEICLRYGIGWRTLEAVLRHLGGGGEGAGDGEGEGEKRREGDQGDGDADGTRRATGAQAGQDKGVYGARVVMLWI
ncbi:hypothetical protein JCM5296_002755 [Sporobolomyces johnsonii]